MNWGEKTFATLCILASCPPSYNLSSSPSFWFNKNDFSLTLRKMVTLLYTFFIILSSEETIITLVLKVVPMDYD